MLETVLAHAGSTIFAYLGTEVDGIRAGINLARAGVLGHAPQDVLKERWLDVAAPDDRPVHPGMTEEELRAAADRAAAGLVRDGSVENLLDRVFTIPAGVPPGLWGATQHAVKLERRQRALRIARDRTPAVDRIRNQTHVFFMDLREDPYNLDDDMERELPCVRGTWYRTVMVADVALALHGSSLSREHRDALIWARGDAAAWEKKTELERVRVLQKHGIFVESLEDTTDAMSATRAYICSETGFPMKIGVLHRVYRWCLARGVPDACEDPAWQFRAKLRLVTEMTEYNNTPFRRPSVQRWLDLKEAVAADARFEGWVPPAIDDPDTRHLTVGWLMHSYKGTLEDLVDALLEFRWWSFRDDEYRETMKDEDVRLRAAFEHPDAPFSKNMTVNATSFSVMRAFGKNLENFVSIVRCSKHIAGLDDIAGTYQSYYDSRVFSTSDGYVELQTTRQTWHAPLVGCPRCSFKSLDPKMHRHLERNHGIVVIKEMRPDFAALKDFARSIDIGQDPVAIVTAFFSTW